MEKNQKIAVIGGTGKSGKYLVQELQQRGFNLKILHRNPENLEIESSLIEVVKGDARDFEAIRALVRDCRAVISTLGQPKGESSIFSHATRNVLQVMKEHKISRYILTTGLNVDTPSDKKGPKTQFGTDWMKTNYPETTTDKQLEYHILSESDIQWTLVRLPLIELTDERKKMAVSLEDCPGDSISATDLAHFLAEQLTDETYIRKSPFIANV